MVVSSNNQCHIRDDNQPMILVRDAATADSNISEDPAKIGTTGYIPIPTYGMQDIGLLFAADGSDGGTFDATIIGYFSKMTREQNSIKWDVPPGQILLKVTVTLGTSVSSDRHAIKGTPWSGATFRYADTLAAASSVDSGTAGNGTPYAYYNAGANNRRAWMSFTPSGRTSFVVLVDNFSSVTSVTIGAFGIG